MGLFEDSPDAITGIPDGCAHAKPALPKETIVAGPRIRRLIQLLSASPTPNGIRNIRSALQSKAAPYLHAAKTFPLRIRKRAVRGFFFGFDAGRGR
jgi:hypothetical protein